MNVCLPLHCVATVQLALAHCCACCFASFGFCWVELDLINEVGGVPDEPCCQNLVLNSLSPDHWCQVCERGASCSCSLPTDPATHRPGVLDLVQHLVLCGSVLELRCCASPIAVGTLGVGIHRYLKFVIRPQPLPQTELWPSTNS